MWSISVRKLLTRQFHSWRYCRPSWNKSRSAVKYYWTQHPSLNTTCHNVAGTTPEAVLKHGTFYKCKTHWINAIVSGQFHRLHETHTLSILSVTFLSRLIRPLSLSEDRAFVSSGGSRVRNDESVIRSWLVPADACPPLGGLFRRQLFALKYKITALRITRRNGTSLLDDVHYVRALVLQWRATKIRKLACV